MVQDTLLKMIVIGEETQNPGISITFFVIYPGQAVILFIVFTNLKAYSMLWYFSFFYTENVVIRVIPDDEAQEKPEATTSDVTNHNLESSAESK